jgi:hypothetical protein
VLGSHPHAQCVFDGEGDQRDHLDRKKQRPIVRLQRRHRIERHGDEVGDDEQDDQAADDESGAITDRAVLQDFIKPAPCIDAGTPDTSLHS